MIQITFVKAGHDDVVLTENDLFDFNTERSCFNGDTFELGGITARSMYLLIDNNTQRFSRGTFANSRARLEINGNFYGYYNVEIPKRRDGTIEITAYDDMMKLDVEYPDTYTFPQVFPAVYAQCLFEAGIASEISQANVINNAVTTVGMIAHTYTDYIYANNCRQLVAGMAEWNGGFCSINENGKLQIDKFSKDVSHTFSSTELMALDYSDEVVTFSKIKTSQKNKTYEVGTDDGYTLVFNNQFISYGLDDAVFENFMTLMYNYYNGFTLTPMTFTLAEPDFTLQLGDRISVYDVEENITVYGNISKIVITGNCSMEITCGGFGNVSSSNNYSSTSKSEISQAQTTGGATAKRLQTNSGDCYVETSGNYVYTKDNNYRSNNRYIYESLSDYGYSKGFNTDTYNFNSNFDGSYAFCNFFNGTKSGRVSLDVGAERLDVSFDNAQLQFASTQLYIQRGGYNITLTPSGFTVRVGSNNIIYYDGARLNLNATGGVYANGTQIG